MKKCHPRFGDSAGIGMALVFMILLVIFPVLLIIQRNAVRESRMSVRDKNIKTAREYAAVMMTDMMRTFASDYNRDVFDPKYLGRVQLSWTTQGEAAATWTPDRLNKWVLVNSRGRFSRNQHLKKWADKGITGVFHFRSDLTRFNHMWDAPDGAPASYNYAMSVDSQFTTFDGSLWVNGDLDTTGGAPVTFQNGVLVIEGDFNASNATLGPNLAVFCKNYTPAAMTVLPVTVNSYPPTKPSAAAAATLLNNPFVPTIDITNPGMGSRLDYFDSRQSTYMVTSAGFPLDLEFIPPATLRVTSAGVPMDWTVPTTATILIKGADLTVHGQISKQVTLIARQDAGVGGNITIMNDLVYQNGTNSASATQNLAVLAESDLIFNADDGANQFVDGFFYTKTGNIRVLNDLRSGELTVNGSLFGRIVEWPDPLSPLGLTVTPDPNLFLYPPPYLPMRPYITIWDYVP
ncbi:MAG: hypothetical protein E6Q99_01115 [Elusimicrobia bacterium]|nr:MAG: hypothetical protein E6Q99_01115 [Elusimicrobiota bacterium]